MNINETNVKMLCDGCEFKSEWGCDDCPIMLRTCESCNERATRIAHGSIGWVMICDTCDPSPDALPLVDDCDDCGGVLVMTDVHGHRVTMCDDCGTSTMDA